MSSICRPKFEFRYPRKDDNVYLPELTVRVKAVLHLVCKSGPVMFCWPHIQGYIHPHVATQHNSVTSLIPVNIIGLQAIHSNAIIKCNNCLCFDWLLQKQAFSKSYPAESINLVSNKCVGVGVTNQLNQA